MGSEVALLVEEGSGILAVWGTAVVVLPEGLPSILLVGSEVALLVEGGAGRLGVCVTAVVLAEGLSSMLFAGPCIAAVVEDGAGPLAVCVMTLVLEESGVRWGLGPEDIKLRPRSWRVRQSRLVAPSLPLVSVSSSRFPPGKPGR